MSKHELDVISQNKIMQNTSHQINITIYTKLLIFPLIQYEKRKFSVTTKCKKRLFRCVVFLFLFCGHEN